jgi:very-short-patch-repair endonuclease
MQNKKRASGAMTSVARTLRREATAAEECLWEIVRARRCEGWRFVRQAPVAHYVLDFYCPGARLAIEIDGSVHDDETVQVLDRERQELLEQEQSLTFLRLSNAAVLTSTDQELRTIIIDAVVKASTSLPSHPRPARRPQ